MRNSVVRFGLLATGIVAAVIACSSDSVTDPNAPIGLELSLTPARDTLFITDTLTGAETVQLLVTASQQSHSITVPAGHVFESQDPMIATVDSSGVVHARSVGTTDVTVRVNEIRAHSTIIVVHPTSRVLVTPATADILQDNAFGPGDTTRVHAQAYGADGKPLQGVRYAFTSSDTSVAVVDASGKVRALKVGAATITGTANGLTGTAVIHVLRATRSLSVNAPTADSIFVDNPIVASDTVALRPVAMDSLGAVRTGVTFAFTSSDPTVETVSPTGVVTAKALGSATITATGADLTMSKVISVLPLAKSVALTAPAPAYLVGDTIPLSATAQGWHGAALTGRKFKYAESGAAASVDSTGHAVFTAPGTATFSATTAFTRSSPVILTAYPREFIGGVAGSVSTGGDATCGLLPLNRVYCFGVAPLIGVARDTVCFNDVADTLHNRRPCTLVPLRIAGNIQLASVSVGDSVACGIEAPQTGAQIPLPARAYCWGDQTYGEVGNGIAQPGTPALPVLVLGPASRPVTFTQISAGHAHACGIDPVGIAYCWGKDSTLQLGGADGRHRVNSSTPTPIFPGTTLRFTSISAGYGHTCALSDSGAAYCWGLDVDGQLGHGTDHDSSDVPTAVAGGLTFVQISAGGRHTCALTASRRVYCWGANDLGQVAQSGLSVQVDTPTLVAGMGYSSISAGGAHTCALQSGTAYCWGKNDYGQLGLGTGTSGTPAFSYTPTAVPSSASGPFSNISAGTRTTCAIAADGAYCWGSSVMGALGSHVQAVGVPFPTKTAPPQ